MKVLAVTLLALVAVASSRNIDIENVIDLEDITAFGYHTKVGISLAEEIRLSEEQAKKEGSRIVGGSSASLGQYPYQAGLIITLPNGQQSVCGGAIMGLRSVLTAAHCWWDGITQAISILVVTGSVNLFSGGQRLTSHRVTMHGTYTPSIVFNDIAMVFLPSSLSFSNTVAPIALPSGNELNDNFAGRTAIASGFGFTRDGGIISSTLQHVSLPVITNNECRSTFGALQGTNLCTSGANGRSTCQGDAGGPLVVTSNGRRILVRIDL